MRQTKNDDGQNTSRMPRRHTGRKIILTNQSNQFCQYHDIECLQTNLHTDWQSLLEQLWDTWCIISCRTCIEKLVGTIATTTEQIKCGRQNADPACNKIGQSNSLCIQFRQCPISIHQAVT